MDGSEMNGIASMQSKAEAAYMAIGDDANKCRPMLGERLEAYRKRMISGLQKHSAKFKLTEISKISDPALLDMVEETVFADSALAARNNIGIAGGGIREIRKREFGRDVTEFTGDNGAWLEQFKYPVQTGRFDSRKGA